MNYMKKRTVKVAGSRGSMLPEKALLIIRSFGLSHIGGYDDDKLRKLQAYVHDIAGEEVEIDELRKLIVSEVRRTEVERQLRDIDRELFAPDLDPDDIRTGSTFCKECGMFKRFRKECPYCGFLEMTV